MKSNYAQLTAESMEELPDAKQAEVYDFVRFLRNSLPISRINEKKKKTAIRDILGIGKRAPRDGSINHDKYIQYET